MRDLLRDPLADLLLPALQFLSNYAGLFVIWPGTVLWESVTGVPVSADAKFRLYATGFVAASFWSWRKQLLRARAAERALTEEKKRKAPPRRFAEGSESLLERYGQTGTFADKRLIPYLDAWIPVSGRFEGIADSLVGKDAVHVSLMLDTGRRIHLQFPGDWRERLQQLYAGQRLTASCQVRQGYGEGAFVLENCELIRVEPFSAAAFAQAS